MVNVGTTQFRDRRLALPEGRSVSAMLSSDDADVRAYIVAKPGWLRYVVLKAAAAKMLSVTWISMKALVSDVVVPGMKGCKINRQKDSLAGIAERDKLDTPLSSRRSDKGDGRSTV
jgi:hypothetical protein